ncbi:MAG: NAD(P)/FAD-dependent oxidoreductase [Chloroflexi bacterium]|nr:NAD(P)/FAD-dependent oxidoreductase [Chloroflexota bacterium]
MGHSYVIIGTGPAGIAATEAIRTKDPDGEITLFGDDCHGFYSRPGLAYYLTGEIPERQLLLRQTASFRHAKTKVIDLHPEQHQIETADGRSYTYDKLLLATGSAASTLSVPGADLKGVVKLDSLDDAKQILKMAQCSKAGVVVGGGITALEIVEALVARGVETHYLLRGDRYWSNVLDEAESAFIEKRLQSHGVRLHYQSELAHIIGRRDRVAGVETQKGEHIACRMVAVAIGVQPRLELAAAAGLRLDRGVLTDEHMQTSAADVFAAGDVAQALDPFTGKTTLDTLWGNALAQGRVAGMNMAGEATPFRKGVPFNVTRLADLTTTIIGAVGKGKDADLLSIARGDSETWRQLPNVMAVQCDSDVNRTRIMVGAKSIVGAVIMGDQTLSHPLHQLIAHRVDTTTLGSELSRPGTSPANMITEFWLEWRRRRDTSQP